MLRVDAFDPHAGFIAGDGLVLTRGLEDRDGQDVARRPGYGPLAAQGVG